ncbi:unnamed protein product [Timema podura]|uniref:STML2-like C-terminal extension domain-containing protein n=1 Tax=Timema podura TaxID=61482 RepID=A0ABN7NTI7_TIMPD|nr:unnamed protein product [Timema podura]
MEAEKQEQINKASGEAQAMLAVADARAQGLQLVAKSLISQDGRNAATLNVAEQYVNAFQQLARTNNTLILPSNANDVTSIVSQHCISVPFQAMTIYNHLAKVQPPVQDSSNAPDINASWQPSTGKATPHAKDPGEYFSDGEDDLFSKTIKPTTTHFKT